MDMHLPYTEPIQYRTLFAGERPKEFSSSYFIRHDVTRAAKTMGEAGKAYVRGRYDNNMRYLDDQIQRVFDQLGDNATVMIVSDQGEESGNTADSNMVTHCNELLRVPLILKGPTVESGRFDAPTSLLDVAPTLAACTTSIQWAWWAAICGNLPMVCVRNTSRTATSIQDRCTVRQWGRFKTSSNTRFHKETRRSLTSKRMPGNNVQIAKMTPTPSKALSDALSDLVQAFRIVLNRTKSGKAVRVVLNQPMEAAWVGDDPTMKGKASVEVMEAKTTARWPKQRYGRGACLATKRHARQLKSISSSEHVQKHTPSTERTQPKAGRPDVLLSTIWWSRSP